MVGWGDLIPNFFSRAISRFSMALLLALMSFTIFNTLSSLALVLFLSPALLFDLLLPLVATGAPTTYDGE
jgi:hypothetical protein